MSSSMPDPLDNVWRTSRPNQGDTAGLRNAAVADRGVWTASRGLTPMRE